MNMPYTYFVSYSHGAGFGSMSLVFRRPIDSWSAVQSATAVAAKEVQRRMPDRSVTANDIMILNWILLSGPDDRTP
jgi:hypothetical protein